jgi:protocatechuate 3,4-dioxygenase beta subunit
MGIARSAARVVARVVVVVVMTGACGRSTRVGPPATHDLLGTVVDPDDRPLGGVALELGNDPADGRIPMATAHTDATGAFRLRRIPPGSFRLTASRRGAVTAALHVDVGASGDAHGAHPVRMVLVPAVALAGTVEDAVGAPVPLARVLVLADSGAQGAVVPTRAADAGGHFRFDGLASGIYRLLIEAPGLGTSVAPHVAVPDESVRVILPGESRFIRGRVVHDGRPVLGARVLLAGETLSEPRRTETDAEGFFIFGGLGPGAYALRADSGGLVSVVLTNVALDRLDRRTADVALLLGPGLFLRGQVRDDAGQPVEGAEVSLDTVPSWGMVELVAGDRNGAWATGALPAGRYQLEARRPGYVSRRMATVELGTPAAGARTLWSSVTHEVPLELVRTAELHGRVVDEAGAPVSGARVEPQLADLEELGVISTPLPLAAEAAALPVGLAAPRAAISSGSGARGAATSLGVGSVVTGEDGVFRLTGLGPGQLRVEISQVEATPFRTLPLELGPGQRRDLGNIALHRAIRLSGRVVGPDGSPVAGARVSASLTSAPGDASASTAASPSAAVSVSGRVTTPASAPVRRPGSALDFFTVTDETGRFSLPLRRGAFRVIASAPHQPVVMALVELAPDRPPPAPITLRLLH